MASSLPNATLWARQSRFHNWATRRKGAWFCLGSHQGQQPNGCTVEYMTAPECFADSQIPLAPRAFPHMTHLTWKNDDDLGRRSQEALFRPRAHRERPEGLLTFLNDITVYAAELGRTAWFRYGPTNKSPGCNWTSGNVRVSQASPKAPWRLHRNTVLRFPGFMCFAGTLQVQHSAKGVKQQQARKPDRTSRGLVVSALLAALKDATHRWE